MGQKFGSGLAGWFWLTVSHKVAWLCRYSHLKVWPGPEDQLPSSPMWLSTRPTSSLNVGWQSQFLISWAFSHNMVATFPKVSDSRERGRNCNVFYDLDLEVPYHYYYHIIFLHFFVISMPNIPWHTVLRTPRSEVVCSTYQASQKPLLLSYSIGHTNSREGGNTEYEYQEARIIGEHSCTLGTTRNN